MSYGGANLPTKSPSLAGLDASDTSSNQQAVPVPWWIGPDRRPLTWIVPEVYEGRTEEIKQTVGKTEAVTGYKYFGSVAGIAGLGLIRAVRYMESANNRVWEGNVVRPDDPLHPDYYFTKIVTSVADAYVSWGRPDQPQDPILLGPLGDANPALRHPNYGNQCRVVLKNYFFGASTNTVPNTVFGLDREPRPLFGNFPAQASAQGESIVAGMLELVTHPIFGAGLDPKYFTIADWEALSAAVIARVGCHAPSLDRARPLRDVIKEFLTYFDGWCRIQDGRLKPGYFPHDGTIPDGLTELSVHDFVARPEVHAGTPSSTINDVTVIFRDGADYLKKKPVSESASDNVEARQGHEPKQLEMLGIIDRNQAQAYAAEAAATGAEGSWEAEGLKVRRSRAKWANGIPLRAGDNFNLDLIAPEVDQVCRLTRRVDPFHGAPTIDLIAERGVFPTPYVPPADLRPALGSPVPEEITHARVLELTPALAGTPLGIPIALLAMRPQALYPDQDTMKTADVIGFNLWYSSAGATYDPLGNTSGWAARGTLRTALAAATADITVQLAMDPANLDLARFVAQSAEGKANDNLLLVIGDEIFTIGAKTIAALNYDLACGRARQGSRAAAHGIGDEAWIVWRDELQIFTHKRFVEDQDRWFKLQPFTRVKTIELVDVDPLVYHFRNRAPEAPVIVIDALAAGLTVGVAYSVTGTISDVNGDLANYRVQAALLTGPGGAIDFAIDLLSANVAPADQALLTFRAKLVFPMAGTWRVVVRADDETERFTSAQTVELTVGAGSGGYGPDDGVAPNPTSSEVVQSGIEAMLLQWINPTNTPVLQVNIYEATTAVRPANFAFFATAPQNWYFRTGLTEGDTRYYWFEVVGVNNRKSTIRGPFSATVVVWPRVSGLESQLATETAQRNADVFTLNNAIDDEETARIAALTAAAAAQTAALNAAIDAEEASFTALVEVKKGEAIAAAAGDATTKVATESTARSSADAALGTRATNLESTVNNATTGLPATKARVDTIETAYASKSYADARKAEAIAAAAADATSKVSTESTARASADTTLSNRTGALESTVNNATTGVAATKARVDTIESTYASTAYADAKKAEAIAAAAADATSKVSTETTARASADTTLSNRTGALESTVNNATTGLPATKARVDTIESTYASTAYADARKAEAIAAAAADATSKVSTESTARASADTTLSNRTGALESTVNNATTGLPATKARVDTIESTYASKSYADARKAEAIVAAAGDAQARVDIEESVRASETGSLKAEWLMGTTTTGGGVRRFSGMRVTNLGGAGGYSEIYFQGDKIVMTNASGNNGRAPFALAVDPNDGLMKAFLDAVMIRVASIKSAHIESLLADKLDAGTLAAMILQAAKTATDSSFFNPSVGISSLMPATATRRGEYTNAHAINGIERIGLVTVYGAGTGTGFANDRYAKATTQFLVMVYSSFSFGATTDYADTQCCYQINGGTWYDFAPSMRNNWYSGGSTMTFDVIELSLGAGDSVRFGIKLTTPVSRNFGYACMGVQHGNV